MRECLTLYQDLSVISSRRHLIPALQPLLCRRHNPNTPINPPKTSQHERRTHMLHGLHIAFWSRLNIHPCHLQKTHQAGDQ